MKCKLCGATPETADFYSSIKNYCKAHWRERVKANRAARADHYKAYDQRRATDQERAAARAAYAKTAAGKAARMRASKSYNDQNKIRRAAHVAVGNAVRDGKLKPLPCFECGTKAEAHHPDYSRPLDVVWLCPVHHKEVHAMAKAA